MPFEPFTFDDSAGQTEEGGARVPENFYLVECEKAVPTDEDRPADKTDGIWYTVRIVSGPDSNPGVGIGSRLRHYNTLKPNAQFGFAHTMNAFGQEAIAKQVSAGKVSIPNYAAFQNLVANIAQRVVGKRAVAFIADRQGNNGRSYSGIEELHPEADWVNYKGATGGGSNGTAQPRPSGPAPAQGGGAAQAIDDLFSDLER